METIYFSDKKCFENYKGYARHHPKYDSDESIEKQKHQHDDRSLEARILINFVHLSQDIITDAHIYRGVVLYCFVDKLLFVEIQFAE